MEFTYKIEDFDTVTPYEELEKIENPFAKQLAEKKLEEYAKKLGYKQFKKMLSGYRKSLKQPITLTEQTNIIDFQNTNQELRLRTWNADETGVWRLGRENMREYACTHPLYPCQLMRNIDTGELKVKLAYRRGNEKIWNIQTVDFDTISNSKNIINLSKIGISVVSGARAQNLVDYINEAIDENYDEIEMVKCVSHLGWNREGFAPFIDNVEFDGNPNYEKSFHAIKRHGDFEAWLDELQALRAYSVVTKTVIAASLASCLIEPLGLLPFFVHLWGMDSGTGKTVAQMAAASIWGDPKLGNSLFHSFKGTSTAFEFQAGFLHSIPLFLDELQLVKDKRGGTTFNVYELASGVGKLRGTKNLGLANVPTWSNCFITSGETPIVGEQDGAGALNRVIEIECTAGRKCIANGQKTAKILTENYGFAGSLFIKKLTEEGNLELARKIYEIQYAKCLKNQTTEKQAMAAAVILTADILASEWLFFDKPLDAADMAEFLKSNEAVSAAARGYRYICDWVAMNYNHFDLSIENVERYGVVDDNCAYIIRAAFDRACHDAGINSKALLSHLKSENLIKTRGDGKGYTVGKRLFQGGAPIQCVPLKLGEDEPSDIEL